ncbi:hypothetical protein [Sphingobium algorifonticola]|nr:hypothetical protein [Sphingobium algorifonticola]
MYPLFLAIIGLLIFAGGVIWKITSADGCTKQNGIVVGGLTRSQHCVGAR